jgi:hypothetical protein
LVLQHDVTVPVQKKKFLLEAVVSDLLRVSKLTGGSITEIYEDTTMLTGLREITLTGRAPLV